MYTEKENIIERVAEYFKDRTEGFADYYTIHVLDWGVRVCMELDRIVFATIYVHNAQRAGLKFRLTARLLGGE